MSFAKQFFNKTISDLSYQDIVDFFADAKDETDRIEFKSNSPKNPNEADFQPINKAVCAFLNSEGGLVIWGAPVGQTVTGKKEKVFQGALTPTTKSFEKDQFINKISSAITPVPRGILFNRLEHAGAYIYVIEIEPSEYSPHQTDNTYYMRLDGQSRPAPHHYIEALFKRIKFPKIDGYIVLSDYRLDGGNFFITATFMVFNQSRYLNADNVHLRAIITKGVRFVGTGASDDYYGMSNHEWNRVDSKVLYNNAPHRFSQQIQINPRELSSIGSEFEIWFYFAANNSPLRISRYKIRLNLTTTQVTDYNGLFTEINENKYWYEHADGLGKTEQDRLKEILGRDPVDRP
ncbi:ATP-binding protein [Flavitalea sp. BT771]|uniref:AlbA family DNA-binding domain-containing protein n=1 Tax=Flavitalea sp. BT771 TaxID=3063329 RepID=UPI0026E206F6|nr:ATP-binding protein [Flavitalea sp. BT771]MDO6433503.1 ATP-binding protein [Flavitalea sp. BT771]MDV6222592.1 ATP-binding protein [Flavitalea sp. BT771]